uniref:DNA-directed primase/polymerase protein n=1 Tax=Nothobranchius pienaari TaxID=704102 RepID=A0A1A8P3H4_9TELE
MVFLLIQYVCGKLMEVYGIKCSVKNVLNLDSSTEEKFSRHLIFILQNAAFKDNIHVGRIVVDLKQEVWYQKCHDPNCRNFRSSSYPLPQEICVSYILTLDEEDQAYVMDDVGNFELDQNQKSRKNPEEETADVWGDDHEYLESLNEFEQNSGEISDQLLLTCVEDCDSQ